MIDVVPNYHSPIFDDRKHRKLSASFYWGLLFAILLHLALLYYFFNHTFTTAFVDNPPDTPSTVLEIYQPPVPPPPTDQKPLPSKVIVAHTPVATTPVDVPTVPIAPQLAPATDDGTKTLPVISTGQGEIASSSPAASPYVEARWTRFPDAAALGQYYPERAANDEVEGLATVECTVLDAAGRVSCRALSEVPGNYGFGKATVRMVQDKGRVDTTQGDVRIGSVLRTTVRWRLG